MHRPFATLSLAALSLTALTLAAENPSDLGRVAVGARPPAFDLPSARGEGNVSLDSLRGAPAVLVFYRGYW